MDDFNGITPMSKAYKLKAAKWLKSILERCSLQPKQEWSEEDEKIIDMNIPDFITDAKSGDILATKYGSLLMVARVEITKKEVNIYYYFDWHKDDGFQMNEWLTGFYGPKYEPDDNFYRPATDEEKKFFTEQMNKFGFKLSEEYGELVPRLTHEGFMKFYMNK